MIMTVENVIKTVIAGNEYLTVENVIKIVLRTYT